MLNLKILPALYGDCFILTFGKDRQVSIIIDSGQGKVCSRYLQSYLAETGSNETAHRLLILTHYDYDHIAGFLDLIKTESINNRNVSEIWFNFGEALSTAVNEEKVFMPLVNTADIETNVNHGVKLYNYIVEKHISMLPYIVAGNKYEINGAMITIVSPSINQLKDLIISGSPIISTNPEELLTGEKSNDYQMKILDAAQQQVNESKVTVENKSSIAFIFEYHGFKLLFLGDSVPSQVADVLRNMGYTENHPLKLDYCKISHHGSANNTSQELVKLLDCSNYILSTKWRSNRPTKACLSKIVMNSKSPVTFYCNYPNRDIFTNDELQQHDILFKIVDDDGITMEK